MAQELKRQTDGRYTLWVEQLGPDRKAVRFRPEDLTLQKAALQRDLAVYQSLQIIAEQDAQIIAALVDSIRGTQKTFAQAMAVKIIDIQEALDAIGKVLV